ITSCTEAVNERSGVPASPSQPPTRCAWDPARSWPATPTAAPATRSGRSPPATATLSSTARAPPATALQPAPATPPPPTPAPSHVIPQTNSQADDLVRRLARHHLQAARLIAAGHTVPPDVLALPGVRVGHRIEDLKTAHVIVGTAMKWATVRDRRWPWAVIDE